MGINLLSPRAHKFLLLLLILAAGVEFGVRGPLRAARLGRGWNDFLSPYIQAKVWTKGLDPYSLKVFLSEWPADLHRPDFVAHDAADGTLVARRGVPSPYPLTSFVLLAPFSVLPWATAHAVWTVVNLLAFACSLGALVSLTGLDWKEPRALLFLAIALALAPIHTGISTGNPAVLVVGLCVGTVWAANRERAKLAGILLGAAVCLKPQVGLCFVLYYLVRRRWSVAGMACGWTAVIAVIAASRLSGVPWLPTYLQDNKSVFGPGAINDFTPLNPVWYNMVNLQVLLWQVVRSAGLANLLALLLGALSLAIWLWLFTKHQPTSELLEISCLIVLSLLPVYHRFYDAELLILPLAWSLTAVKGQHKRLALLTLVCILPFLAPGASLLNQLAEGGRIPVAIGSPWWWNVFAVSHEVWALLALGFLLLCAMAIFRTAEGDRLSHVESKMKANASG